MPYAGVARERLAAELQEDAVVAQVRGDAGAGCRLRARLQRRLHASAQFALDCSPELEAREAPDGDVLAELGDRLRARRLSDRAVGLCLMNGCSSRQTSVKNFSTWPSTIFSITCAGLPLLARPARGRWLRSCSSSSAGTSSRRT